MSRVEQFEQIRRDARLEGLSVRALAARHHVHRRTVRQALAAAVPPARKVPARAAPRLGPWKAQIEAWLAADRMAPRKQRHTARRIWQRLRSEHGADVAEATVRSYVSQVRARTRTTVAQVPVPQTHPPGAEAECDFGEVYADHEQGGRIKLYLFVLRLSASGRAFHRLFANQTQEAFLEGHVGGLTHFGGVPHRIRYDNLTPAVVSVLQGRSRAENERFIALRSHYGFDAFFCQPGIAGAHEKGGVEGEVGRFRRTHLVPVPRLTSLADLNAELAAADAADDGRRLAGRSTTVGEDFAIEAACLQPLPAEPFDASRLLAVRVDSKARVSVRQSRYSVPVRYASRRLTVRLSASQVAVLDGPSVVAEHERSLHKGVEVLVLDHYLETLAVKPGALAGATALAQARASGAFTATHERFWETARRQRGDRAGTQALIEVLLAHRQLPVDAVVAGMERVLAIGSVDPALVQIEARRTLGRPAPVLVLPDPLPHDDRPLPGLDAYDSLLEVSRWLA
jgi:transposase